MRNADMQHHASASRVTHHASAATLRQLRTPHSAFRFPGLHPPRAADGHRHHGHPGRHRPADHPGPEAQCQSGGHAAVARRGGPRPPACHQPAHHRLYGLPVHQLLDGLCLRLHSWTPTIGQATNLLDKQLIGYAYVCLRSVGDQPGVHTSALFVLVEDLAARGLHSPGKFWPGLTLTNTALAPGATCSSPRSATPTASRSPRRQHRVRRALHRPALYRV